MRERLFAGTDPNAIDPASIDPASIDPDVMGPYTNAPPWTRLALESLSILEYASLLAVGPLWQLVKPGDGHPVLVLPGFGASDRSTATLRTLLEWFGHRVHGWRLGTNVGPHPRVLAGMTERMQELHQRYGQSVSVVGWSLGGVYAREMAREHPDQIRHVIGLATPFRYRPGDRTHASSLYDLIAPGENPFVGQRIREHDRPPLPVPYSAVYSRSDGIVRWHLCTESEGPQRENIEVLGTHTGLVHNFAAVVAIADRLSQPKGDWRPFAAPPLLRTLYPSPAYWLPPKARLRSKPA